MQDSIIVTQEEKVENEKFNSLNVTALSAGHAVHDTFSGFLPPLIPVFIEKFAFSKTEVGILSLFVQLPSLLQPLIGHLADRSDLRWVVILSPAVTAAAMSLLGIAPAYGWIAFLLTIAGISSAALHAIGPVMTGVQSGSNLGKGMSFWMVGGELGRTLGPLAVVSTIALLTLDGLPLLMLAGFLISFFLYFRIRQIPRSAFQTLEPIQWKKSLAEMRSVMAPLLGVTIVKSFMAVSLSTYLPTYLTEKGSNLWLAGASLSILEAAGVLGALLGGSISDRIGRRKVLAISFSATAVFLWLFTHSVSTLQIPLLLLLGFFSLSVTPVMMAIAQENFPNNRSLANGVFMAFNFIAQAIVTIIFGSFADRYGLQQAFSFSTVIILAGLPLILLLPKSKKQSTSRGDQIKPSSNSTGAL